MSLQKGTSQYTNNMSFRSKKMHLLNSRWRLSCAATKFSLIFSLTALIWDKIIQHEMARNLHYFPMLWYWLAQKETSQNTFLSVRVLYRAPKKSLEATKEPPQKDNKKPILRISVEEPAENPQALLFAHVRKGRKQPVNCPRPRYLKSAAKNDLSIRVKPHRYTMCTYGA